MRVLIYSTGQDTGGQGTRIKELLERHVPNIEVRSIIHTPTYIGYPTDIVLPLGDHESIQHWFDWADVLHLRHLIDPLYKYGRTLFRPAILHQHGTKFINNHHKSFPRVAALGIPQFVSGMEMHQMEPQTHWLPQPHDIEALIALKESIPRDRPDNVIRIIQAPTRESKGPYLVAAAIEELRSRLPKRRKIEFESIRGVSWAECLRRKAQGDIFIDQVGPGAWGYGNNSVEAWAMEMPVISEGPPEALAHMRETWGELPFLTPTKTHTLADILEELVLSRDMRGEWAAKGLVQALRFHDYPAIAKQLNTAYNEQWEKKGSFRWWTPIPDIKPAANGESQPRRESRKTNILVYSAGADTAGQGYRIKKAVEAAANPERISVVQAYVTDKPWNFPAQLKATKESSPALFANADIVHMMKSLIVLERYGHRGQPTLVHYQGSEFRSEHRRLAAEARFLGVRQLVTTLDLVLLEPDITWIPQPSPVDEFKAIRERVYRRDGVIRIAHAPTDRTIKSTELIIHSVKRLIESHSTRQRPIEFDLIENVPWAECLERKARADVFIDQLILGYGVNALEAWGMGIPVVAGVEDPRVRKYMKEIIGKLPFFNVDTANFYEKLRSLVLSPELSAQYGARGHAYVRKFHDEAIVGRQLLEIYATQQPLLRSPSAARKKFDTRSSEDYALAHPA
jgi:hypothetical protein